MVPCCKREAQTRFCSPGHCLGTDYRHAAAKRRLPLRQVRLRLPRSLGLQHAHGFESLGAKVETCPEARAYDTARPHTLRNNDPIDYWPLTLEEAIRIGLTNSRVLRDAGGRVLTGPANVQSTFDPAIRETSPSQGTIAAESVYDATYHAGVDWLDSNRFFNNILLGGGANQVANNSTFLYNGVSKRTATGGDVSLNNITSYNNNNAPGNMFDSLWNTTFIGTMSQPLLQGGGVDSTRSLVLRACPASTTAC